MFRRRTTDQVYATLQQVQRRITEGATTPGTGAYARSGTARVAHPTPMPVEGAAHNPGTGSYTPSAAPGTARVPDPALVAAAQAQLQPPPPSGRFALHIPLGLAMTLALVWLLTLALAFLLGQRSGRPAGAAEPPPPAETATEAPPGRRGGEWLLVLKSVPNHTPALREQWQREIDRLNAYMVQQAARGWKPYFALRQPANGQLEFVFGKADGRFGIDRDAFEDFARLMAQPPPKGGGYASAKWVKAE